MLRASFFFQFFFSVGLVLDDELGIDKRQRRLRIRLGCARLSSNDAYRKVLSCNVLPEPHIGRRAREPPRYLCNTTAKSVNVPHRSARRSLTRCLSLSLSHTHTRARAQSVSVSSHNLCHFFSRQKLRPVGLEDDGGSGLAFAKSDIHDDATTARFACSLLFLADHDPSPAVASPSESEYYTAILSERSEIRGGGGGGRQPSAARGKETRLEVTKGRRRRRRRRVTLTFWHDT